MRVRGRCKPCVAAFAAVVWMLGSAVPSLATTVEVPGLDELCNVTFPGAVKELNADYEAVTCVDAVLVQREIPELKVVPKPRLDLYLGGKFLERNEQIFAVHSEMLAAGDISHELMKLDTQWTHPLDDYLVDLNFLDTSHLRKKYLELNRRGKLLGVPETPNQQVFFFRRDLFTKHGLEYSTESWEKWEEVMLQLKARERAAGNTDFYPVGVAFGNSANRVTFNWVTLMSGHNAGQIIESDGRVTVKNAAAIKTLMMWKRWYGTIIDPAVLEMNRHAFRSEYFMKNKTAVMLGWAADSQHFYAVQRTYPEWGWDVQMGPIPGPTGAGCMGVWSLSLSKHTRNMDEARRTLELLVSPESMVERGWRKWFADYSTDIVRENATLWKRYCSMNPMICYSNEKWPGFWERAVYRPAEVCGTLYDSCVEKVFRGVTDVMLRNRDPMEAVTEMERELNVLLGYLDPDELNKEYNAWEEPSRVAVIVVSVVSVGCLVGMAALTILRRRALTGLAQQGCTVSLSILLAVVVGAVLIASLSSVIAMGYSTMKSISTDLAEEVRKQTLETFKVSVLGGFEALVFAGTTDLLTLKTQATAKVSASLYRMDLDSRSLVLMIDREPPHRVLVTSNVRLQKKGVSLEGVNMYADVANDGVSLYVRKLLRQVPEWKTGGYPDEKKTYRFNVDGDAVSGNIAVVKNEIRNTHTSTDMSYRKLDWLALYMMPDKVILQEADESLDRSLDVSILMGMIALVVAVGFSVVITAPLMVLGVNIDRVRVLDLAGISQQSPGVMTEVSLLVSGFQSMCAQLEQYKSFMPKTMFDDDEDATDNSEKTSSAGNSDSTKSSRSASSIQSNRNGVVNPADRVMLKMQSKRAGVLMVASIQSDDQKLWDHQGGFSLLVNAFEEVRQLTLHAFSAIAADELVLSCGVSRPCATGVDIMTRTMLSLKEAFRGKLQVHFAAEVGELLAGNTGTAATRGYVMLGEVVRAVKLLKKIGTEIGSHINKSLLLVGEKYRLRAKAKALLVDLAPSDKNSLLPISHLLSLETAENDEWMYELDAQAKEAAGSALSTCLTGIKDSKSFAACSTWSSAGLESVSELEKKLLDILFAVRNKDRVPKGIDSVLLYALRAIREES